MSASTEDTEREEIEMLLPWYVTGKLEASDLARVEAYLAAHPDAARQLDLARDERDETVAANEALPAPAAGLADRIMAELPAARPGRAALRAVKDGLHRFLALIVAPPPGALRWAAVAAVVLVAVQAVAIATLIGQRQGAYQAASGRQTGDGVAFLVAFADGATAAAISQLLAELDASIVDGPKAGGVYKIVLRTEDRSPAAHEALMRRLAERSDVVRGVLPSKD